MKQYLIFLLTIMFSVACSDDYQVIDQEPQLVVEGWAEAGQPPVVYLTTTVPVQIKFQELDLSEHIIRYATVRVSDGEETVVLTGRVHRGHRIPFEYTTGRMTCQPGKKYSLSVDYESYHAEATAYVPEKAILDTLYAEKQDNGAYHIIAFPAYIDTLQCGRCFIRSSCTYGDFLLAPLSMLSSNRLELELPSIQGQNNYSFLPGEEVIVRCSQLDSIGDQFWTSYEQSLYLSRNFLMPLTENIYSNVDGALGYWLGYGSSYYRIKIPD